MRKLFSAIVATAACALLLAGVLAGCSGSGASASASSKASSSAEQSESSEAKEPITPAELKAKGIYVQVKEGDVFDEHGNKVTFLSGSRNDVNTYTYPDPAAGYYSILHTERAPVEGLPGLDMSMEAYADWEFDDQGRAVSMTSTAPDGRVYAVNNWKYNDEGTMVESSNSTGLIFTYDDYGYIVSKSNGSRSIAYEWIRDEDGMVTGYIETEGSSNSEFAVDVNEAGYITAIYRVTDGERASAPEKTFSYQKVDTPSTCVALTSFCKEV